MAKKRRPVHPEQFANSAAYSALWSEAKSLLEGLQAIAESSGRDKSDPILVEAERGRFVKVRLSDKWRKFGPPRLKISSTPDASSTLPKPPFEAGTHYLYLGGRGARLRYSNMRPTPTPTCARHVRRRAGLRSRHTSIQPSSE
jgi:hypothetical protein